MFIRHPYWARRRIDQLSVEKDFKEIHHLAFEVRYATPLFTHSLFSVAFARQAAVPSIAEVLFRNGKGSIITNARKRNNDTLLFFGEFFRHGNNAQGRKIAAQLNAIHRHFPITNEQNLYTLATLICEPVRMSIFLTKSNIFSPKETRAIFLFWRMMAELLEISDVPEDEHLMMDFYKTYEQKNFAYSEAGRAVVEALANEFSERWYPKWMNETGKQVYFSLFDEPLLHAFQLQPPLPAIRFAVRSYLWTFLKIWIPLLPDPAKGSIVDLFNKDYDDYSISKVGPLF